ncbi:restriction endonuclease subunit S [Yersinia enterocolitica]|nr:restriction endonuclease subunit S [Yersinia enterocolitica]
MSFNVIKLGQLLATLTDYHANGAYKALKENVELLDTPNYALMIRTTNFENDDFTDSVKYISKSAYDFLSKSKVYPTDIIMNKIANAGSVYLMPDLSRPVSLAMNLFLLRVDNNKANPIYVYIFLKINESYVKQFANGSVTKTITKDAVRNLDIVLPPRTEQDKIARFYQIISNKINNNNKINQSLEQMAQALFKSWFVDFEPIKAKIAVLEAGGSPEDATLAAMTAISGKDADALVVFEREHPEQYVELKATAELFPSAMQDSELGEIPVGWVSEILGAVLEPKKGKNITKKTIEEGDIPVVAGGLAPAYYHSKCNVTGPVITISASGANAGFVNLYHCDIWASDCSYINKTQTQFVYCFYTLLKSRQKEITHMQQGAAQPHVSPKDIMRLVIVAPITALWQSLEKILTSIYEQIGVHLAQNMCLESLRDILLPKLLSGEITLPEAEQAVSEAENV